jgi:prepilin-type N-terminal cleavage/methylation domain-containing protein
VESVVRFCGAGLLRLPKGAPRGGGQAGFSLVEMLVVIAVLGLLAALAIPGYNSMVHSSREAGCAANLRTTGTALFAYAADHNNYLPHGSSQQVWNNPLTIARALVGTNGVAGYLPFRSYPDLRQPRFWSDAMHSPGDPNAAHYRPLRGYSSSYIYRQGHNSPGSAQNGKPIRPGMFGETPRPSAGPETKPRWLLAGRWGSFGGPNRDPHGRGRNDPVMVGSHPSGTTDGQSVDCPWYRKPGTWVFYEDGSLRWRSYPEEALGLW